MSNILVTGATGFLGRHLVPVLQAQGHRVYAMDSKIGFPVMDDEGPIDYIYHLAAYTRAGDWCLSHSGEQWLVNQKINTDVLKFWKEHAPQAKIITIGSSCAYAPGSNLVEDNYMLGEPHESLYTYAMTKRMLYDGCRALNKQYGMKYLYLVPSTLYGPDYHTDGRQAHFIFDLMRKIIRGKELGEPVVLWGDGSQIRDVIYVGDFIRNMLSLNEVYENDIFNISVICCSIKKYAEEICDVVGYDPNKIGYDVNRHVGADNKNLDTGKIMRSKVGLRATPWVYTVKETVQWFYKSGAWK